MKNWEIKVMKPKLEVKYPPEILGCTPETLTGAPHILTDPPKKNR